jgi:hypothetical protein
LIGFWNDFESIIIVNNYISKLSGLNDLVTILATALVKTSSLAHRVERAIKHCGIILLSVCGNILFI